MRSSPRNWARRLAVVMAQLFRPARVTYGFLQRPSHSNMTYRPVCAMVSPCTPVCQLAAAQHVLHGHCEAAYSSIALLRVDDSPMRLVQLCLLAPSRRQTNLWLTLILVHGLAHCGGLADVLQDLLVVQVDALQPKGSTATSTWLLPATRQWLCIV